MTRLFDALLAVCEAAGNNPVVIHTNSPVPGRLSFARCDRELWIEFVSDKRADITQKYVTRSNDGHLDVIFKGSFDANWKRVAFRDDGQSERVVVEFLNKWCSQVKM